MAWLWAQFCISKTVSLKKFLVGGTPVRKSSVSHPYVLKNADQWGGVIEFYNSSEEKKWTDSGPNVPHYPALSGIWWSTLAQAVSSELTPQETMTGLAQKQDEMMGRLKMEQYPPTLGPFRSREYWLHRPGAPKQERPRPKPQTIPYDELIQRWRRP